MNNSVITETTSLNAVGVYEVVRVLTDDFSLPVSKIEANRCYYSKCRRCTVVFRRFVCPLCGNEIAPSNRRTDEVKRMAHGCVVPYECGCGARLALCKGGVRGIRYPEAVEDII